MALKLFYITNRPDVAKIAESVGVDRIFADMEYLGKETRQPGDTVKSHHTVEDIRRLSAALSSAELLVRVNPIAPPCEGFPGSDAEINAVIDAGADIVMLPMAKTPEELRTFVRLVGGRAKTMFLLETREAAENLDEMLAVGGIDEVHIGLNDLHLAYGKRFMFELLSDGTVDRLCATLKRHGLPYGFGGIARIGYGLLPSEYVIAEHYRLLSGAAILSRSFCNIKDVSDIEECARLFSEGVAGIRRFEAKAAAFTEEEFRENRKTVCTSIRAILKEMEK